MSAWQQIGFQDAASPFMEELLHLYDHVMVVLILVVMVVALILISTLMNSFSNMNLTEGHTVEVIWTVIPMFLLLFIAFPSLYLLYVSDDVGDPALTIKAVGHQWFWSYEYSDFYNVEYDSYMTPTYNLDSMSFRLLDVDNRVVVPYNMWIRMLVTSTDVIHSWTVPSLGVKADAFPGRLNQITFWLSRPGLFFGQCSEICGANHSFMPIVIESVDSDTFINWVSQLSDSTPTASWWD